MEDFVQGFLETDRELALCQLVGHSYDLDVLNLWDQMERLCHRVGNAPDVWPATHIEIVRYLGALKKLRISHEEISNESSTVLWLCIDGNTVALEPGESIRR